MMKNKYIAYISKFGKIDERSMFGGTGVFQSNAMFALLVKDKLFIRGGLGMDTELSRLQCERYRQIKRKNTVTIDYFDVTYLFELRDPILDDLVQRSIIDAVMDRESYQRFVVRRLRDMPNMYLKLERMVKKAGVMDVDTFIALGAPKVFNMVRDIYGKGVDIRVLWKFAGAIEGVHWQLIQEPRKRQLLDSCYDR